jgi:hypothetical protein
MWREGLLYRTSAELIALGLCLTMFLAAWAGYRVALRRTTKAEAEAEAEAEIGPVEGTVSAVLALVLAFSFSMASERFDARQERVVSQSNAIGTAFLRCSALDSGDRSYCEDQLRGYVDLFVAYGNTPHSDGDAHAESTLRQADKVEHDLWARLSAIAHERPTAVNAVLLTAMNDVIDRRSDRVASMRIVVPQEVTFVLLLLCVLWAVVAGYSYGLKRNEKRAAWVLCSVLVALVVYVTLDFDRPRRGIIRLDAGNQSMVDLQQALRSHDSSHEAAFRAPSGR